MVATMKGTQFGAKRMTLSAEINQVLNLQFSLHSESKSMISPVSVCDVFNVLCGPLHLASECSSWRERGGCFGREHFLLFWSALFDMQHCCTVIMLGLWLS